VIIHFLNPASCRCKALFMEVARRGIRVVGFPRWVETEAALGLVSELAANRAPTTMAPRKVC
jgi:hypothetical protein